MKNLIPVILLSVLFSCKNQTENPHLNSGIKGTWKMIYAETKENDSLIVKDLSNTNFIKIINDSHFAFFNQNSLDPNQFYGGGGTYSFNDTSSYTETLNYTSVDAIRGHQFPFTVEIKGDTLIQSGIEDIKEANIYREIIEKYIRVN